MFGPEMGLYSGVRGGGRVTMGVYGGEGRLG